MHPTSTTTAPPPMSPDERTFFEALGLRIAKVRQNADLTQQQLADSLAIPQPQLASYEIGRRRLPVSLLPKIAHVLGVAVEALIDGDAPPPDARARIRRGPVSRLEQQLDAIGRLPKAKQKFVVEMLDTVLAQQSA